MHGEVQFVAAAKLTHALASRAAVLHVKTLRTDALDVPPTG